MKPKFLVSGTGPHCGKTMAGCAIAFALRVRAMRVGVMKPIAVGCTPDDARLPGAHDSDDANSLLAAAGADLPLEIVSLYRYRAALGPLQAAVADGAPPPDFAAISRALGTIERSSDAVIVEEACGVDDACGLAARIDAEHDFADLAIAQRLEVILVVASRPGFVAAAGRSLAYARERGLTIRGAILNALDPDASATVAHDAARLAATTNVRILGTVRYKEPLSLAIIEQLL
ncbi:MAG TPA: ATP-dependent dethiobiotin synthetase BioD [Candidatus Binataceae bacterium]|nr:ATP-dependent dethiobiotin synthetase BioD [Candidatus Binataceae bacterium]